MAEYLAIYNASLENTSTGYREHRREERRFQAESDMAAREKAKDLEEEIANMAIKRGHAELQSLFEIRKISLS